MDSRDVSHGPALLNALSRRDLLKGAAALAAVWSAPAWAKSQGTVLAYVGSYTPNGQGISLFEVDPSTGSLTPRNVFPSTTNPSWLAFDPSHRYLYAVNEI